MPSICDRKPDAEQKIGGGLTVHVFRAVPRAQAADLIFCRRKDTDYWDDDVALEDDPKTCTVLISYKKQS